jgi:hypothetical protein
MPFLGICNGFLGWADRCGAGHHRRALVLLCSFRSFHLQSLAPLGRIRGIPLLAGCQGSGIRPVVAAALGFTSRGIAFVAKGRLQ